MLTAGELSRGIYGAWRLAHLDAAGIEYFDRTVDGFWKSFWAAAVVLPGYVILLAFQLAKIEVTASVPQIVIVQAISYVITWTAFPVAMYYATAVMGRQEQYVDYIVAHNWSIVIQIGVLLPVTIVMALGILPEFVGLFVGLAILYYEWFIAKTALKIDGLPAVGVVALNFVIDFILTVVTKGLIT